VYPDPGRLRGRRRRALLDPQTRAFGGGPTFAVARAVPSWPTVVVMPALLYGRKLLVPSVYPYLLYVAGGPSKWVGMVAAVTLGIVATLGRARPA
jgi:hypothetical protein